MSNHFENDQLSSDIIPMEEEALCLNEDTVDGAPNENNATMDAKEYLFNHLTDHQLDLGDFTALPNDEKMRVVREIDQLELDLEDGISLSQDRAMSLQEDLATKKLRHSVYTKNLVLDPVVVKDKFSLPPLLTNLATLRDEEEFLHWYDWLGCEQYYSLNAAFPINGASEYEISIDADATCVHSPTLLVLKQTLQLHCAPNFDKFSRKIKHKYQNILLHNCVNIEIGQIGLKWKVFAVFIDLQRGDKSAAALIRAFYVKLIEGVKKSDQAGRTGFEKHTEEFLQRGVNKDQMSPIEPKTLEKIMANLASFEFNRRKVNIVFSFQYCGQKDGLRSVKDVSSYIDNIEATFDINGICDPEEKKYEGVMFIQDMALVISPRHNPKNPMTICWSPQFLNSLKTPASSSIAHLYHSNERNPTEENDDFHPEKPRCDIYPNLGIGSLQSAMVSFSDTKGSIYEIKAYFSGSAYWRRHQPYDSTAHSASVLPYETLLMGSSVPVSARRKIVKESEERKRAFLKSNPETAKIEAALAKLEGMSYGARLEISFLNLSKYQLMAKFQDLSKLGRDMIETHCLLASMYMEKRIPLETLRLSPIQVVTTQSLVQLASFQAKLLNHMYKTLFMAAAEDASKLESDLINALILLEDMQQFLWSGSIKDLMHPTLFQRLGIVENLFKYNRFYIGRDIFAYNPEDPKRTATNFPLQRIVPPNVVLDADDFNLEQDDITLQSTQLAVTRRLFYRAFGGKQYENILSACRSLNATAQLLMSTKSSFFSPLYDSKSMVIACNILNAMLAELFNYIGIREEDRKAFFDGMCDVNLPANGRVIKVSGSTMDFDSLLENVFCMGHDTLPSIVQSDFYDLWKHCFKVVSELNEQWKWSAFATFRSKDPESVAVLPTITRRDIVKQMLIVCHQYELKWFPVINRESLVLRRRGDQRFYIARVRIPFESSILPVRGMANCPPLPHPVDISFVYMLARLVAKHHGGPECRVNEMVGHIMYHYTKLPSTKKLPTPRYSNLTKESLVECCLFSDENLTLISRNKLYDMYQNWDVDHD